MHDRQHCIHLPGQGIFYNHLFIIPATGIHKHPMDQHAIFGMGKLQEITWREQNDTNTNEWRITTDQIFYWQWYLLNVYEYIFLQSKKES